MSYLAFLASGRFVDRLNKLGLDNPLSGETLLFDRGGDCGVMWEQPVAYPFRYTMLRENLDDHST